MLRASARGLCVGRRRHLMASLLAFSSSASGLPPKPSPSHTAPPPPPASASARASRFRLLLARASARRDPEPPPPPPPQAESEKKSIAVRTGELFLGLSALFVRAGRGTAPVDEVEQREGVLWEQRPEDVEAERQRREVATASPGFSFSAAGLLFPYHLGVAQCLLDKGYITERTPLAGSSAGAIICAVIASGKTMQEALQVTKILAEDCRSKGTAFRLGAVLKDVLEKFLPDDLHIRCNGRIRVAITQLSWRPRGLLVDQFDSKEDVINAIITSSFIPGYLAPRPATLFRNRLCVDGGLTLFMPPTSASETVRICAFPAGRLGLQGIGISPDCNPENRATPRQLFNWALEPAEDEVLDKLYELGYQDAAVWAEQNPPESTVKIEQLVTD
ncbi:patatin-like phospholipase domain-containing protein 4 [Triticum dicoccoides]|uniref:patatin-like phospholipase domain-containing protein 4 n=1 Tax=Triticum dicoccoides TaxID=85692 RepID=UPI0018909AA4|nr:patatin-like phospholipase domain-containing protein 4 [Triticum dicoccoides]